MDGNAEKIVRNLLEEAGITINGPERWDIQINDSHFYRRVLSDAELGLGESYMDGWWDCEALDELADRIYRADLHNKVRENWRTVLHVLQSRLFNRQRTSRAYQVGQDHYDLGNDLYRAMLDRRMNYTCAYWKDAETLDEAQEAKLDLICRKLHLQEGMKVLELGCGWGAFAGYAAGKYGVEVTGVTVSREQVELGNERYRHLPVELRLQDYRSVEGTYDRVVSVGILEHVGYRNYRTYMDVVDRTLKPGGLAFIHTIGNNESVTSVNRWTDRYIFPNGMIPSMTQINSAMEGLFIMEDWHNIGPHYDTTLMAWYANFEKAWPELRERYGDRFYRMWRFYLLAAAAGFRARLQQLWQIVMTRPGDHHPESRVN